VACGGGDVAATASAACRLACFHHLERMSSAIAAITAAAATKYLVTR
jgi:hypothetical protein